MKVIKKLFSNSRFSILFACLILLAMACTTSLGNDQSAQATLAAASLQGTIQAQAATQAALEQQNMQIAIEATQAALDRLKTEIAVQTTLSAMPTEEQPTASGTLPTPTVAITPTPNVPTSVPLTQFSGSGWSFVQSSQCHDRQKGCWLGTVKANQFTTLSGKEQVYLDPAWTFPHLVFWTRYKSFYGFTFGYVELDIQGQVGYTRVQSFGGTKDYWERVYIPLLDYAGTTVAVRFYFQGPDGTTPNQPSSFTWFLEDIQITPNFPK
ncbi:MAG: hypothetical protein DDG59_15345 [Anaerolineae bacterium]|jgi:hypothetical protein|nr:MAG: hypothetical protein DDG59_15345 [Anaerolineae bacterium]